MSQELVDYAHAAEAALAHGSRAAQYLVDVMQSAVRAGSLMKAHAPNVLCG